MRTAWASLFIGLALLAGGIFDVSGHGWFLAHGIILLGGFLAPAVTALHVRSLQVLARAPGRSTRGIAAAYGVGAGVAGFGWWLAPITFGLGALLLVLGLVLLLGATVLTTVWIFASLPKGSIVDEARDPLTKGDDACMKHVRIAHIFLPLGLALWILGLVTGEIGQPDDAWPARIHVAGMHVLAGYLLLSMYGLGHLWVPRFSGVPAIAAGAIKGELHTTMLGITGLLAGFLTGIDGLIVAFGPIVFLGFFTYMGVLGANIMRNKSVTQRVTPEFVYIPWTFSGVFWMISGVLMGVFLKAIPDLLSDQAAALVWIHVHIILFGGVTQLLLGWWTRALTPVAPPFAGAMKAAFYTFNAALGLALFGQLRDGATGGMVASGAALAILSLALYLRAMGGFMGRGASGAADGSA